MTWRKSRSAIASTPDFWNRGLVTEAARAVRDHAFDDLKLPHVISLIHPENAASRRVAEKSGMTLRRSTTFRGFPALVFQVDRSDADDSASAATDGGKAAECRSRNSSASAR